jgi:sigma-B regulation protein RsbU (phosphoserine phosphatase)
VLFTDGISDARNRDGDRLGETKILEAIKKHRAKEPAEILDKVFEILNKYVGRTPLRDDLTMVLLKN